MANVNPLRYRGYFYDTETGFYYLQSRYYDPVNHRFINADSFMSTGQGIIGANTFAYCRNCPVIRVDSAGTKDYIYTGQDAYTIENDWGVFEFLNIDRYYIDIGGERYFANSEETVTLHSWSAIDKDFLDTTFNTLIAQADEKTCTPYRILTESVGGALDFKLQLPKDQLFLVEGVVYNRNECGNFIWAYYLTSKGYSSFVSSALAQGGSLLPGLANMDGSARFDEPWDVRARHHGVRYAYKVSFQSIIELN